MRMSATTNVLTEVKNFKVEEIEPLWLNPNSMSEETFSLLVEDMKERGPYAIDPIEIAEKIPSSAFPGSQNIEAQYVCVNGTHRLKAAKKLKWKVIPAILNREIKDETQLLNLNYRKNKERGETTPEGEARLFQYLHNQGKTDEEIAKEFSIDRSQVTRRRSLLRISPETNEKLEKVPNVTTSMKEIVATLDAPLQEKVSDEMIQRASYSRVTEKDVSEFAKKAKEKEKEIKEFAEAVEKSPFKTCPVCKEPAVEAAYEGLPIVDCGKYHLWSLKDGKLQRDYSSTIANIKKKEKQASYSSSLRSTHTYAEFQNVFDALIRDSMKHVESIEEFNIRGKASDGGQAFILLRSYSDTMNFKLQVGRRKEFDFQVEKKEYSTEALKEFKTSITIEVPSAHGEKKKQEEVDDLFISAPKRIELTKEEIEALHDLSKRVAKKEHFRPNSLQELALKKSLKLAGI